MAKKKREVCPYCGKGFASLARHKCKIKERVEGPVDEKTNVERRIERIEEKKKSFTRNLKKDEKTILNVINREKDIYFDDLVKVVGKQREEVEETLEILTLQSKVKVSRELIDSSWTKHIFAIEDYAQEGDEKEIEIQTTENDFLWKLFSYQPCFICPFVDKCNETNIDQFNPHHCPWLTQWIETLIEGKEYRINFDEIKNEFFD